MNFERELRAYDEAAEIKRDEFIATLHQKLNRFLPTPRIELIEYEKKTTNKTKLPSWATGSYRVWKAVLVSQEERLTISAPELDYTEEELTSFVEMYKTIAKIKEVLVVNRGYCLEEND